jgi:hypothetical protein
MTEGERQPANPCQHHEQPNGPAVSHVHASFLPSRLQLVCPALPDLGAQRISYGAPLASMVKDGPLPRQAVEYCSHAYRTARHSIVQHCTVFCRQSWLWGQSEALSTRQRSQSVVRAGITGGHSAIVLRPHDRKGIPICQAVSLHATREPGRSPGSDNGHYGAHNLALRNEIRTWCVVREGCCRKKGLFFP